MLHANGISLTGDVLDLAMAQKLIGRSGAWFRYGELQLGQGRERTRQYLDEHPELMVELREKILAEAQHLPLTVEGGNSEADGDGAEPDLSG